LVEQRIENPRVGGSIPPLGTTYLKACSQSQAFFISGLCKTVQVCRKKAQTGKNQTG
jgi:hypothetical protein